MSTFDTTTIIIYIIIFGIPFIGLSFFLITGLIKNEVDKGEKGSTGIVGWIIAILIACAIFYALFFASGDFNHYRHT